MSINATLFGEFLVFFIVLSIPIFAVISYKIGKRKSTMKMKSPMKGKISASCKAQAKKKFKVWPSAYASGALAKCRKVGASSWGSKKQMGGIDVDFRTADEKKTDSKAQRKQDRKHGRKQERKRETKRKSDKRDGGREERRATRKIPTLLMILHSL